MVLIFFKEYAFGTTLPSAPCAAAQAALPLLRYWKKQYNLKRQKHSIATNHELKKTGKSEKLRIKS